MKISRNELSLRSMNEFRSSLRNGISVHHYLNQIPEVLFISTYPPRECGIATYTTDLINALKKKFGDSFKLTICPLESKNEKHTYPNGVGSILNTDQPEDYLKIKREINQNERLSMVLIQHEFGLFENKENEFCDLIKNIKKPVIIVFHTVLPNPNSKHLVHVQEIANLVDSIIVMTKYSQEILIRDYGVSPNLITIIPHGTHLVEYRDKENLKLKANLSGKIVLSTFGLISSGKCIESTLKALPEVVKKHPDSVFLILGKTHPTVLKQEGEKYRKSLEDLVIELNLENHVRFINYFLPLNELLDFLQLTDIYLFTSKDPNQAVSGTFSYAISSGCPIISTPIPHAVEVLKDGTGILFGFEDSAALTKCLNEIIENEELRKKIILNGIHKMAPTAWENSAIQHARLIENMDPNAIQLKYSIPEINLSHILQMTTDFGIIQFSEINQPDILTGYTLDDNARALIAISQKYELFGKEEDLKLITIYLDFIEFCQKENGRFLNYVDQYKEFTSQNFSTNLADSNGRAIWALGYFTSLKAIFPEELIEKAELIFKKAISHIHGIHSTRAMAFIIKGLYFRNRFYYSENEVELISLFSERLVKMYQHESNDNWFWFESYLTYANSILPEALLCAWKITHNQDYKKIACESFDFLLSKIFKNGKIHVISNKNWMHKESDTIHITAGGEQPIDVAYTILALEKFNEFLDDNSYREKLISSFNWFLGENHLHQIIYNPCTGGCYDGLEENNINLNQGAESTISYLLARLSIENVLRKKPFAEESDTAFHKEKHSLNDFRNSIERKIKKVTN